MIIGATVLFGVMSVASAWSPNLPILAAARILSGLGLGASQPNAATLASEYAPNRYRALMVTVVYCGFTLGAAGGGFLANALIPSHGWRSVLVVGGVMPLLFAVLLFATLPESVKFLALKHDGRKALEKIVNRITPGTANASTEFTTTERPHVGRGAIGLIVSVPHTVVTLALWCGLFVNLMTVYFLNSWLPMMIKDNGFTLVHASLVGAMFQVGGTLGNVVIGWEMDRFNPHRVMIGTLLAAGILTAALGHINPGLYGLMTLVFLLGYCINATNSGWTAMAAAYYPTETRATGISWMTGIGRFGAIAGASVGAVLIGLGWNLGQLFLVLTVPIGIGIAAAYAKGRQEAANEGSLRKVVTH